MRVSAGRALLVAYNAVVYAWLLAPILIVVVFSFSAGAGFDFPPRALSLRWFRYLAGRDEFFSAAYVSLKVAVAVNTSSAYSAGIVVLDSEVGRERTATKTAAVLTDP